MRGESLTAVGVQREQMDVLVNFRILGHRVVVIIGTNGLAFGEKKVITEK